VWVAESSGVLRVVEGYRGGYDGETGGARGRSLKPGGATSLHLKLSEKIRTEVETNLKRSLVQGSG